MDDQTTFSFGKNWRDFLKGFDAERLKTAETSLLEFLGVSDLSGKTFVDVGCGSGLFSYAAFKLGADKVVSFDVDPFSVQCCLFLREKEGDPSNWEVMEGSALDKEFLARLGRFDVVYSWGVLHHTGRMWEAIANTAEMTAAGGSLYMALYNKILGRNGATSWIHSFWISLKKTYNSSPALGKYVLAPLAMTAYLAMVAARGENPFRHVREYKSQRGMSWRTDAVDWLGGYPYEFATVEEVFRFVKTDFPEFSLENLKVTSGRGLNWFLFVRNAG